jgi:hypothetical protein
MILTIITDPLGDSQYTELRENMQQLSNHMPSNRTHVVVDGEAPGPGLLNIRASGRRFAGAEGVMRFGIDRAYLDFMENTERLQRCC